MESIILSIAFFLGIVAVKPFIKFSKMGYNPPTNLFNSIIDIAITPVMLSLIVWGFMHMEWWRAISMIVFASIFAGVYVNEKNIYKIHAYRAIPSLISIGLTIFAWMEF